MLAYLVLQKKIDIGLTTFQKICKNTHGQLELLTSIYKTVLGQIRKIGVFTVCRPTLLYSCRPYHFFYKNKKHETVVLSCLSSPGFKYRHSNFSLILFYSVCSQTFYGYLRILFIQDGDVLVTFRFKKSDHQDQKSLFEATSHHQMT